LSHHQSESYEFSRFFYYPRTITGMAFALLTLNYFAYVLVPLHDAA
jgi:hypothetical protein